MLPALLLLACVNEPTPDVSAPVGPPPGALLSVLQSDLGLSHAVVKRLRAKTTTTCALVVDPEDPAGCTTEATCRAWAFTATDAAWKPAAIGTVDGLPTDRRCDEAGPLAPLTGS
jgi:hypothetical protein